MRSAWNIAMKDLRLRVRDRSVFIIGLIAPFALAFIFNLVFGGGFNDVGQQITLDVGAVVDDGGQIGQAFTGLLESLEAEGFVDLQTFPDMAAADQAVENGEISAVVHIPEGATSQAQQPGGAFVIDVLGNVDAPTTTDIVTAIANDFANGVEQANLATFTAVGTGVLDPAEAGQAAARAAQENALVRLGDIETEVRQLDSSTWFVAGLSIFFIFFIAGLSVTSMLEERRDGTLSRLLAAPIQRSSVVLGKSLTSMIIGLVSMTVLVVASTLLMDADWGPPVGVALLVATAVLAVTGIMTLVGGFARTPEQAGNLQSVVAVTFAMLGGTFVPITNSDGFLASLQYVTPNAWFMRGLAEMATGEVAAGFPAAGVLIAIALVTGGLGAVLVGRLVRP
jgi:ABC-2 type transport system permease protein